MKALRMAIKRDERNVSYHNNLACALLQSKEWNKALASFSRVVDMTGESQRRGVQQPGLCGCMGKSKWKEAQAYLKRALELEEKTRELTCDSPSPDSGRSQSPFFTLSWPSAVWSRVC